MRYSFCEVALCYNTGVQGSDIGQLILVGALAIITWWYARQTKRQADLLQEEIAETRKWRVRSENQYSLERINAWATNLISEMLRIEGALPEGVPDSFVVAVSDITSIRSDVTRFKRELADTAQQAFNNLTAFVEAANAADNDVGRVQSLVKNLITSLMQLKLAVSTETIRQRQLE